MSLETPSQYEKGLEDGIRIGAIEERDAIIEWLRDLGLRDVAECIEDKEHLS